MKSELIKEAEAEEIARLTRRHDSDGWFEKAPRHVWKDVWGEYSPLLESYHIEKTCIICGAKEEYLYRPPSD